jgi:4-hydroxy-tetrahydrodipicolinate reductase
MGHRILELAVAEGIEIAGAFDVPSFAGMDIVVGAQSGKPRILKAAAAASEALRGTDVLIDFTAPEGAVENVAAAAKLGKPSVVGTTGLSSDQQKILSDLARTVPVVYAPNMSVGVNLMFKLTTEIAKALGLEYNVEVIEIHHNQKRDSPSGTAMRLAECASAGLGLDPGKDLVHGRRGLVGARGPREIGMHSLRGGDVTGDHTIVFAGPGERLELTHRAHSRDNFARGALRAARFVIRAKPGLYDMQDVLGLR